MLESSTDLFSVETWAERRAALLLNDLFIIQGILMRLLEKEDYS